VRRIHFKTFADSTYVTEELQDAALPQQSTFSATVTARQKASKINALFIVFTYTTHNHSGALRSSLTATTLCSVLRRGKREQTLCLCNTEQNKTQAVIGSLLIPDTPPRAALLTDGHLRISEG
jgi:hypothetical protein